MEICPEGALALRPGRLLKLYAGIRRLRGRN